MVHPFIFISVFNCLIFLSGLTCIFALPTVDNTYNRMCCLIKVEFTKRSSHLKYIGHSWFHLTDWLTSDHQKAICSQNMDSNLFPSCQIKSSLLLTTDSDIHLSPSSLGFWCKCWAVQYLSLIIIIITTINQFVVVSLLGIETEALYWNCTLEGENWPKSIDFDL